jgi:glycosyltransferase involved in cell wall biosynthesis
MHANEPRLTVAVPVFNGERYLPELFACLEAQTFEDLEIIMVDNASSDRTAALCRSFAASDQRARYFRNDTNLGAARNFNRAFELGNGTYFKWAAHDDLFAPEYLARCVDVLDRDPSAVLCQADVLFTGADLRPMPYDPRSGCYLDATGQPRVRGEPRGLVGAPDPVRRFADVLHRVRFCIEVFGVIRAAALARTSLHGSYYGSDKVLLAELALLGRFARIPEPLFTKRVHERTTLYFTTRERDAWIDPAAHHRVPQLQVLKGYLRALGRAELTPLRRLGCLASVAEKFFALDVLKRLALPRPDNYFGWRGRPTH